MHVIQSGDSFSSLAAKYLGHAKHASLIAKANPGVQPRRLRVGMRVKIPPAPLTPAQATSSVKQPTTPRKVKVSEPIPPVPAKHAYKVKPGEGWYDLSRRFLGDGTRWPELFELNRERVSHNPQLLRAGTVIELPRTVASAAKR